MRLSSWLTRNLTYPAALSLMGQQDLYRRLEGLETEQWEPPERSQARRTRLLRRLLAHALDSVPFYRGTVPGVDGADVTRMPDEEVGQLHEAFPLVTKRDLQDEIEAMTSRSHGERVGSKTTGGSTGEPVTIRKPAEALAQERAAMWLAYGWFGVGIGDRCVRFWGVPQNDRRRRLSRFADAAMNRTTLSAFSFSREDLREYWARLTRFRPDYIHGYVSMVDEFVLCGLEEGIAAPVKGLKSVILTAEAVSDIQHERIAAVLGAPVQVEYGCGELGPIAHECPEGCLHVHAMNVGVELVDEDGFPAQQGRVVLTDLHNLAMPLIRYDIGDFAEWGEQCDCGRSFETLEKVFGRAYDAVIDPSGRRFHGEYFMYIFEDLRQAGSTVSQFQIHQRSSSRLDVRIICPEEFRETEARRVAESLQAQVPQFEIDVQPTSDIPRLPSGKMQVISNELVAAS